MKIVNRIAANFDESDQKELSAIGIKVPLGMNAFEVDDAAPAWGQVASWIEKRRPVVLANTKFSKHELIKAELLAMYPQWHHGYPMPDLDNGYIDKTFDTRNGCIVCGVGWKQIAPFRMKSEPKWGKRQILQLNWVFDEYFVTPDVYDLVFRPFGIKCLEVLHHKNDRPLNTVVQLVVDETADGTLVIDKFPDEICDVCGRGKFHPHTRGFFPKLRDGTDAPILKSFNYFGSGGSARRAVLISSNLYQEMESFKLKGVSFYPLAQ